MYRSKAIIVLGIVAVLCGVCAVAVLVAGGAITAFVYSRFTSDPAQVRALSSDIAEFDLPPGYSQLAHEMFGRTAVVLSPPSGTKQPTLMLSAAETATTESLANEVTRIIARDKMKENGYQITRDTLKLDTAHIRGEDVELVVIDGYKENRIVYRYIVARFTARNGKPALLTIHGPMAQWNQDLIDRFMASLR